ncbi:hypothetical protein M2157_009821 [Streptomyces sp. SAI-127]|nr:hypothetical protein [Streptomyces sp. SAI-127]
MPLSVLPSRPNHCRPTCAVAVPSLRSPESSITMTPSSCGAVAGSSRSSSSRRSLTSSASQGDSDRKNCSRCTPGIPAPATGSAPARQVIVLFRSRGARSPVQVLAKPSPLGQAEEEVVEPGRVLLQRTRRRRTRTASGHLQPPARQLTPTTGLRPTRPAVNPCHHRIQRTTARRDGGTRSQPRRRPGQARSARRGGNSSTHHRPRHAHLLQPGRTHIHGQSHSTILNALAPASLRPGTAA